MSHAQRKCDSSMTVMHKLLTVVFFKKCVWTLMDPVIRGGSLQMWRQSERDSWLVHQRSRGGWFTLNFTISVGGGLKTCICMLYIGHRPWLSVWWRRTSLQPPDVIVALSGSQISSASVCEVISPKIAWTAEAEGACGNNRTYTHGPVWRTRNHVSKSTAVHAPDVCFRQQEGTARVKLAVRLDLTDRRGPNTHTQSSRGTIPLFLLACTVLPWCHTSGPWIPAAQCWGGALLSWPHGGVDTVFHVHVPGAAPLPGTRRTRAADVKHKKMGGLASPAWRGCIERWSWSSWQQLWTPTFCLSMSSTDIWKDARVSMYCLFCFLFLFCLWEQPTVLENSLHKHNIWVNNIRHLLTFSLFLPLLL